MPYSERLGHIHSRGGNPKTRIFAELLIDCEEDRTVRAVVVGMLRRHAEVPRQQGAPK